MRYYLLIEKGTAQQKTFLLEQRLTVGRVPSNDIHSPDPTVSRNHAVICMSQGKAVVEDLGSLNGTFLNGNRVQKAILSGGDTLRFGDIIFRLMQQEEEPDSLKLTEPHEAFDYSYLTETQGIFDSEISVSSKAGEHSGHPQRIFEAIACAPPFFHLEEDDLINVSSAAEVVIFDRGRTIVQETERIQAFYVVLQGTVRVLTYDQDGSEVELEHLCEGHIFGESSFFNGTPLSATVQALDASVLCKVKFKTVRDILDKRPIIRQQFEVYCRSRQEELQAKRREAGIIEQGSELSSNVSLPVTFWISAARGAAGRLHGKVSRSFSQNISVSGIRIKVQKQVLFGVPPGSRFRLEISLPHPWGALQCSGILRSAERRKEGKDLGYLNVRFTGLSRNQRETLEEFLRGD